eukprot:9492559-Pyramimonas_sp.AAC.1
MLECLYVIRVVRGVRKQSARWRSSPSISSPVHRKPDSAGEPVAKAVIEDQLTLYSQKQVFYKMEFTVLTAAEPVISGQKWICTKWLKVKAPKGVFTTPVIDANVDVVSEVGDSGAGADAAVGGEAVGATNNTVVGVQ